MIRFKTMINRSTILLIVSPCADVSFGLNLINIWLLDHCSEIYYDEEKNNDSYPLNSKVNILVYKGTEKNFNFILQINFSTPKNQGFKLAFEWKLIV